VIATPEPRDESRSASWCCDSPRRRGGAVQERILTSVASCAGVTVFARTSDCGQSNLSVDPHAPTAWCLRCYRQQLLEMLQATLTAASCYKERCLLLQISQHSCLQAASDRPTSFGTVQAYLSGAGTRGARQGAGQS